MTRHLFIAGIFFVVIVSQGFDRGYSAAATRLNLSERDFNPAAPGFPDTASPSFFLTSDIHLHGEDDQTAAVTKNSDSGKDLWDSAETKIRAVLSGRAGVGKPKFIIYLGDLPWHSKDASQVPDAMKSAGVVLRDLRMLAESAHVVLLYVPGNNDSEDGDYGPFSTKLFSEDPAGPGRWPIFDGAYNISSSPEPRGNTAALSLGCYSAYPLKKTHSFEVLVMNTNVFTARYDSVCGRDRQTADAETELKWLEKELAAAAADHRHVLIAMHVPPGKDGFLKAAPGREICTGKFKDFWDPAVRVEGRAQKDGKTISAQDAFLDLTDGYRSSIVGIVSSHTHLDGLRLLRTRTGDGVSTLLVSVPGIAPGHGNNPGFKVISYDPVNFQWKGFTTFYSNFFPDRTVKTWGDLSFSFRAAPGVSMFDQVRHMSADSLRNYVNSVYMLYNGDGYSMGSCVDTTLYVHYQR
jgi:sphingomyelin phosphodiesterase acid-like 3